MTVEYCVAVCKELEQRFRAAVICRPMRISRYDPGTELVYEVTGLSEPNRVRVGLIVEQFVGGGFAGQVYKVRLVGVDNITGSVAGLHPGGVYALKILVPPSGFARWFRNLLYRIGFQGPFQPQVNPAAAKAVGLWQKFIRRGARMRLGGESAVADIYATCVDGGIGSCAEICEWVEGRNWRLEADERMDLLKRWRKGRQVDTGVLGCAEYRAKYEFMAGLVNLMHEMGAYELARQYEWSTWKSQPNCLKRTGSGADAAAGLVAVDFKAGLALLPFLPMSPVDFKLIAKGIARGSLVQFDRGSVRKLEMFVQAHEYEFSDMKPMLQELKELERIYRDSQPDITHNHIRLFYSGRLWSRIMDGAVSGWRVRNIIDDVHARKLRGSRILCAVFWVAGIIPVLGGFLRRAWGHKDWRRHYWLMVSSWGYFRRAFSARAAELLIKWHRAGRVASQRALRLADKPGRFLCHLLLCWLPAGLHRLVTDRQYARRRIADLVVRPVRLYFDPQLRQQWLREMVAEGQREHTLTEEDTGVILSQIDEPFIQKYLVSLAVHLLTLPVTQMVSVTIAAVYVILHWNEPNAFAIGLGIIGAFQAIPISPGSLARGSYVLYLVKRDRNFRDYNIAVFLAFLKYIGYLAFPIQMAYRYPALARFMASRWATTAAHIVPVFGEKGALLEHTVFCWFYNWPLTIRRRMVERASLRARTEPRYWHVPLYAVGAAAIFALVDVVYLRSLGQPAGLKEIWYLAVAVPLVCGAGVTVGCGGALLLRRVVGAFVCGLGAAVLTAAARGLVMAAWGQLQSKEMAGMLVWYVFLFSVLAAVGGIVTELTLPEPG